MYFLGENDAEKKGCMQGNLKGESAMAAILLTYGGCSYCIFRFFSLLSPNQFLFKVCCFSCVDKSLI